MVFPIKLIFMWEIALNYVENQTTAEKLFELIEHLSKSHYMQNKSL